VKKQFKIKSKSIFVLLSCFVVIISIGCTTTKYNHGELLKPYYVSSITKEEDGAKKIPVSIRFKKLDYTFPSVESGGGKAALILIPIVSAIQKNPVRILTNVRPDIGGNVKRIPGEVEKLMIEELNKLNLFDQVVLEGAQKDYDIRGKVDFKLNVRRPNAGLGIFGTLPPGLFLMIFFTPIEILDYICEAHFEVIDTKTNKTIFSEDYNSEKSQFVGVFYGNRPGLQQQSMFGKKIFPSIVKEFINDLKVNLKQNVNTAQLNKN